MASLPVLSGQEAVRIFETFGWTVARQKSSHIIKCLLHTANPLLDQQTR